jgi:hypothetical protein
MIIIELDFKGYRREESKAGLEDKAGIYCVYAGTYNPDTNKVNVQRLLYIGKALSIKNRIGGDDHEHLSDWKRALKPGQILMYTRAFLSDGEDRTRAEAALIYYCQPPINDDGKDGFHHPDTKMVVGGEHKLIDDEFTVYCTD